MTNWTKSYSDLLADSKLNPGPYANTSPIVSAWMWPKRSARRSKRATPTTGPTDPKSTADRTTST